MKKTIIFLTSFFLLFTSFVFSQDGSLDTSFDTDGKVTTDINLDNDNGNGIAIQSDGKIVVVGYTWNNIDSRNEFVVVRYNTDGSLDNAFGTSGKVTTAFGGSGEAYAVAIQSDGKIVVAGVANSDFALVRYNTDGSLDTSFDVDGKVTTGFGGDEHYASGLSIQSDGRIVVAGYIENYTTNEFDFAVARYNTDGSLDITFDSDGKVITDFNGNNDAGRGVAIQSDGKIVVVGDSDDFSSAVFAVARYNTDGSLDTSFDSDGKVTTGIITSSYCYSVAIQTDGKIVAAGQTFDGTSFDHFALVRYNTNGSLDTSFDGDGKLTTDFGNYSYAYSVAIQSDGKIIAGGDLFGKFASARYNIDGSLDTSYDGDGKVVTAIGPNDDKGKSIAIQSDGKIVFAGTAVNSSNTNTDLAVVQYNNSISTSISVDIKVFLEGPYNSLNMNTSLTVPTTSPYTEDPETVSSIPNISGNEVVDWVLVQLRDQNNESNILESQSAFLLQDGTVVDVDGSSPVQFSQPGNTSYYIAVKHRNHLAVMSNSPVAF